MKTNKTIMSSKGQIVIPKIYRNQLGLHTGMELTVNIRNKEIIELKPVARNIQNFFALGKDASANKCEIDELISEAVIDNDR